MVIEKKERETNQQTLRRFNRFIQGSQLLQRARDLMEFKKDPNRAEVRKSAVRREKLRKARLWY